MTKEDAEKLGINFSSGGGGPPKFKNNKKVLNDESNLRQVVDANKDEKPANQSKDLRQIIEQEKQKNIQEDEGFTINRVGNEDRTRGKY